MPELPPPRACHCSEFKAAADWTEEMEAEATSFYISNYISAFCMRDVCDAYAQIPQVMMWGEWAGNKQQHSRLVVVGRGLNLLCLDCR